MLYNTNDRKIVSISEKRQITIPQKFFKKLNFTDEAECLLRGSEIVIRPTNREYMEDYSDLILSDLIKEGYSGDELIKEFKARRENIKKAVQYILNDANRVSDGDAEYMTLEEVFGRD